MWLNVPTTSMEPRSTTIAPKSQPSLPNPLGHSILILTNLSSIVHTLWMSTSFLSSRSSLWRSRRTREGWPYVPHPWPNIFWRLPDQLVLRHWLCFLWAHRRLTPLTKPTCERLSFRPCAGAPRSAPSSLATSCSWAILKCNDHLLDRARPRRSSPLRCSSFRSSVINFKLTGMNLLQHPSERWFNAWRHCSYAKEPTVAPTVPNFILQLTNNWTMSSLRFGLEAS